MPSFLILLVLLGLMYFMLIVPRQRELRRHNQLMSELGEGQEVMTTAGIYGTISWIRDDRVGLKVADDVLLEVAKRSIAMRVVDAADTPEAVEPGDVESGDVESGEEESTAEPGVVEE